MAEQATEANALEARLCKCPGHPSSEPPAKKKQIQQKLAKTSVFYACSESLLDGVTLLNQREIEMKPSLAYGTVSLPSLQHKFTLSHVQLTKL